jgi:hypothetical protein
LTRGFVSARETPVERKAQKIVVKKITGKDGSIFPLLLKLFKFPYQYLKVRTRIDIVDVYVTDNSFFVDYK